MCKAGQSWPGLRVQSSPISSLEQCVEQYTVPASRSKDFEFAVFGMLQKASVHVGIARL